MRARTATTAPASCAPRRAVLLPRVRPGSPPEAAGAPVRSPRPAFPSGRAPRPPSPRRTPPAAAPRRARPLLDQRALQLSRASSSSPRRAVRLDRVPPRPPPSSPAAGGHQHERPLAALALGGQPGEHRRAVPRSTSSKLGQLAAGRQRPAGSARGGHSSVARTRCGASKKTTVSGRARSPTRRRPRAGGAPAGSRRR